MKMKKGWVQRGTPGSRGGQRGRNAVAVGRNKKGRTIKKER